MKNKLLKLFATILLFFLSLSFISSNKKVQATSNFDDFRNFSFIISPDLKLGNIIWTVHVNWNTSKEIKYLDITIMLEDGQEELTYLTGRDNLSKLTVTKLEDEYEYNLVFNINSTEKLQVIKFIITYSYVDEIDPSPDNIKVKTYYLSPGNTRYPEKIKIWSFLLIGVIISMCAAVATFIIIQNTKTNLLKVGNNSDDYGDEEDDE